MRMRRPTPTDAKAVWRRWAKRTRAELPTANLSEKVVQQLRAWEPYRRAQHVLSYLAFGSELDISALHADPKTFYLTRTWEGASWELTLHPLTAGLEQHPYGYWQPAADAPQVAPEVIDLVLTPGLCFDQRGTRLGYGKGYYDRLLPSLAAKTVLVGVTATPLLVHTLPAEPFDVPMTHLVTEARVAASEFRDSLL